MSLLSKDDQNRQGLGNDEESEAAEHRSPASIQPARPVAGPPLRAEAEAGAGFFSIYKPGQGYWTRMGTAASALLLLALVAYNLYVTLRTRTNLDMYRVYREGKETLEEGFPVWKLSIVGGLTLGGLILFWWMFNSPRVTDFLIATDGEMKKVNWTSRKELFGSTKVVILFMFLLAAILFLYDVLFGYVLHWIRVLKTGPFA